MSISKRALFPKEYELIDKLVYYYAKAEEEDFK